MIFLSFKIKYENVHLQIKIMYILLEEIGEQTRCFRAMRVGMLGSYWTCFAFIDANEIPLGTC